MAAIAVPDRSAVPANAAANLVSMTFKPPGLVVRLGVPPSAAGTATAGQSMKRHAPRPDGAREVERAPRKTARLAEISRVNRIDEARQ
jgi:hypothetical protein